MPCRPGAEVPSSPSALDPDGGCRVREVLQPSRQLFAPVMAALGAHPLLQPGAAHNLLLQAKGYVSGLKVQQGGVTKKQGGAGSQQKGPVSHLLRKFSQRMAPSGIEASASQLRQNMGSPALPGNAQGVGGGAGKGADVVEMRLAAQLKQQAKAEVAERVAELQRLQNRWQQFKALAQAYGYVVQGSSGSGDGGGSRGAVQQQPQGELRRVSRALPPKL